MKKEIVDIRYVAKIIFLMASSLNLGHTFEVTWLGLLFALYFAVVGILNATSRKDFSKRPKYNKIPAYGAIVPLALYWVVTPGVENGVNPMMVFLPGLYLLFLAALQERSRGNGGFEAFVAFDGVAALLFGMFMVPHGWGAVGLVGLLLALFAYSRRGTAWHKYLLFVLLIAILSGIAYGGWRYWRNHRYEYGSRMAEDYYQRERVMGFDPVAALGNFRSNYDGKYNDQVVLRVWDSLPPKYLKAASYEKYIAGLWKLPQQPLVTLMPAYYQVDYAVMEVGDRLTRPLDSAGIVRRPRQVWVQSTLKNFGFIFAPYGSIGFAAKDVDSLHYFAGGMVNGLDKNGKRSDWYYFACEHSCEVPDSLMRPSDGDLLLGDRYIPLMDSVIAAMDLHKEEGDSLVLQKMLAYFRSNFIYSLSVPGLERWRGATDASHDPLTVFWREKKGFCEYYATLSALTLRRLGIPARYATGFINPEVVEGRPYGIYRRRSSHAWVEAFVDGRWVIFDPTPPVLFPLGAEPSWFNVKWESLSGRTARIVHFLKEGGWRRSVDSWQNYTQSFLDSGFPYIILGIMLALLSGIKIRGTLKNRKKRMTVKSPNAVMWTKKLDMAERELSRSGLRREVGETVGKFILRAQTFHDQMETSTPKQVASKGRIQTAIAQLQEYEANRWNQP